MSGRIFHSFHIGCFTIIPAGDPPPDPCGLPIILGKKGAFGSGEHETTAACLELLPSVPGLDGRRILDLGSGTGILALAAARLGASAIVAIDLDEAAARSCQENSCFNGFKDRITTVCGELATVAGQHFDLILANIYADILLSLAEPLVSMTSAGGYLLLSGIPLQDKFDIQQRYGRLNCNIIDSRIGEEFATYLLQKS